MRHTILVFLFAFSLVLKTSTVAGAEVEYGGDSRYNALTPVDTDEDYNQNQNQNTNQNQNYNQNRDQNYTNNQNYNQNTNENYNQNNNQNYNQNYNRKTQKNNYIANNVIVGDPKPVAPPVAQYRPYGAAPAYAGGAVYAKEAAYPAPWSRLAIIPQLGGSWFTGQWGEHTSNLATFGFSLEIPTSPFFSVELESGYGRYNVKYGVNPSTMYTHDFNQFIFGGNGKVYLLRGGFRPYLGAGLLGLYYDGMTYGPFTPSYSRLMGALQFMAGADISVTEDVALGLRGAWILPLINRPYTVDNGVSSAINYADAALMNNNIVKVMGTVRVAL